LDKNVSIKTLGFENVSENVLLIPLDPDTLPNEMMNMAFDSKDANSSFVHDEISRAVSQCPPTGKLKLNLKDWSFTTWSLSGTQKFVGGDDFFVYYVDPVVNMSTFIARTTDHENGTYSLSFTASPFVNSSTPSFSEKGTLVVWLEYTCGAGRILRPFKDTWRTIGAVNVNWNVDNVKRPPFREFVPPNQDGTSDFGNIRTLLGLGDSVMQQFFSYQYNRFYKKNLGFGRNVGDPLLGRNWAQHFRLLSNRLRSIFQVHNYTGVILGMAAWELQKPFGNGDAPIPGQPYADNDLFQDHLTALRSLITRLRSQFPLLKIFWKSGLYMHLHVVARDKGMRWLSVRRIEYECQYRTELLHKKQNELMENLGIPIMHLMDATYLMPDHHRNPGDSMHYDVEANALMLDWFYPRGLNESLWDF